MGREGYETGGVAGVNVGAVINRPGIRRIPSTGRWIRTGAWRAIGDRPYGRDREGFGACDVAGDQ